MGWLVFVNACGCLLCVVVCLFVDVVRVCLSCVVVACMLCVSCVCIGFPFCLLIVDCCSLFVACC